MDEKRCTTLTIGFGDVLTIVFVVLKLCKVITWSWWWVLSPIWIPMTIVLTIIVILGFLSKL